MLKKVILGLALFFALLIGGLAIFIATRPDSFVVQRSIVIKATPEPIYPLIADFHKWERWSPYERLDPKMERSFAGKESGLGAKYIWDGNEKAGAGTMEIIEAVPPSKVAIKLDFSKPFEGHNVAEFKLEPEGDKTSVSWSMSGPSSVMMKFAGLFMNMDSMIGRDFEIGLDNLKSEVEKSKSDRDEAGEQKGDQGEVGKSKTEPGEGKDSAVEKKDSEKKDSEKKDSEKE
ncbi:MAG TPA: SRPBCC family protein [Drouetiella sp.]|jgi:uncharacterized protein YndB with AHSA1/START domain